MLREKLSLVPKQPGCYLFKDKDGTVIYVGKAKILKNRLTSYFMGAHEGKTQRLVNEIVDFEYIVTSSELESFVLEINMIKKYDPKYNIIHTDDKTYPFIHLTDEVHPRLLVVRNVKKKRGKYFGPYPNVYAARETANLLNRIYPFRKCHNIPKKECLYYHIGQCTAPCIKSIDKNTYEPYIQKLTKFLKGDYKDVKNELESKMIDASQNLQFERAKEYRDLITHIESTVEKQKMHLNDFKDRDVFGLYYNKGWMCVQVFFIRGGKLIERDVSIFPLLSDPIDDFETFIATFYEHEKNIKPSEIILPKDKNTELLEELLKIKVSAPTRGDKKKLADLACKNAEISLNEKFSLIERDEERSIGAIEGLSKSLDINIPYRIEAFDNSNIQGTSAVSAMVVFVDGKPSKKDYRKYKIKSIDGPDDYGTMKEVIYRRYFRVLKDGLKRPDLIVIDGGIGQVNASVEVLDSLGFDIPVIGLKKNDKHKTSDVIDRSGNVVELKKNSNEFYLLHRIQDEVHRFAITFHRSVRSKSTFASILDDIEGIGEARKKKLLRHFGSLKKMKEAPLDELENLLPKNIAKELFNTLNSE